MSQTKEPYKKRFTGEGPHLLDPILAHPLMGGRDNFIKEHLLKSNRSAQPSLGSLQSGTNENENLIENLIQEEHPGVGGYDEEFMQSPSPVKAKKVQISEKYELDQRLKMIRELAGLDSDDEELNA